MPAPQPDRRSDRWIEVRNLSRPQCPVFRARWCASFLCRLRGLTFRKSLLPGEGLLLVQSRPSRLDAAIHMLFVFIPLTIVWLNPLRQVVDVRLARPWRPLYYPKAPAQYVLEVAAQYFGCYAVGDQVLFNETSSAP